MLDFPISTFAVVNLGCKVNRVESDAVQAAFMAQHAIPVAQEDAEVIVVNTCTVTGEADKKARKAVRHALAVNPDARVVVTGCAVAIDPLTYSGLSDRVEVVQRADLMSTVSNWGGGRLRLGSGFNTRVGIKVQDGCDHACTYCIVHVARGKAKSVAADKVLEEARAYLENGVMELVLTGIDLASYRDGAIKLPQLIEMILEEADKTAPTGGLPARVRASSIEPHTIDEDLVSLLARSDGKLCRHLHIPLQSGSSKVLREMARPYDAKRFGELVAHLYEEIPGLSLTTDIIVGFPGETESDFERTLEVARACRFSKIHVFPYSKRRGTPAASREDQIGYQEKSMRARRLRNLSDQLRKEDFERRRGTVELAIVEGECALTESYHEIAVPEGAVAGSLVPVVLESRL